MRSVPAKVEHYLGASSSEIKAPPGHETRVVSRQACFANVGTHGVNRASCGETNISYQCRTAIAVASHPGLPIVDIGTRDAIQIIFIFQ